RMAGDEIALPSPGRVIPQQPAVRERQRPGQLDGAVDADRPQPEPRSPAGLEKDGAVPPGWILVNRAEPAHGLAAGSEDRVVRIPHGEPEAPAAPRLAGGIVGTSQLPDLLAPQDPPIGSVPLGADPQLAPSESGERHAELDTPKLARAGAAGIRSLIDVAHQPRREPRLAEGRNGNEAERQSASPQTGGEHGIRVLPPAPR